MKEVAKYVSWIQDVLMNFPVFLTIHVHPVGFSVICYHDKETPSVAVIRLIGLKLYRIQLQSYTAV